MSRRGYGGAKKKAASKLTAGYKPAKIVRRKRFKISKVRAVSSSRG